MSNVCPWQMDTKFIVRDEGAERSILAMRRVFEDVAIILSASFLQLRRQKLLPHLGIKK